MATDVEWLIREIRSLSADDRRRVHQALAAEAPGTGSAAPESGEAEDRAYQELLVRAGLLESVRIRRRDQTSQTSFENFRPISVVGKPVSETIIEERR
jgi:hypothetical protein